MEYAPFLFSALGRERDPAACFLTDVFRPCTHRHGYGGAILSPAAVFGTAAAPFGQTAYRKKIMEGFGESVGFPAGRMVRLGPAAAVGKVGKLGDAYRSVLYAGALHIGADCLFQVLFQPDALEIQVAPIWGLPVLLGETGGIGTLRPWQIIGIAIGHQIRRSRRGKKIWHTPSKTL